MNSQLYNPVIDYMHDIFGYFGIFCKYLSGNSLFIVTIVTLMISLKIKKILQIITSSQ